MPRQTPKPVFDTNHVLDTITEDSVARMVLRLTYAAYDPLSARERDRVRSVAIYQARAQKEYERMVGRG